MLATRHFAIVIGLLLALHHVPSPVASRAKQLTYFAVLNSGQQRESSTSTAFGVAYLRLNGTTLCYSVTYAGLSSDVTFAHIHGPAPAGGSAGVLETFPSLVNPMNGCMEITGDTKQALKKGTAYINIHTEVEFPGEIRGQIHRAR